VQSQPPLFDGCHSNVSAHVTFAESLCKPNNLCVTKQSSIRDDSGERQPPSDAHKTTFYISFEHNPARIMHGFLITAPAASAPRNVRSISRPARPLIDPQLAEEGLMPQPRVRDELAVLQNLDIRLA